MTVFGGVYTVIGYRLTEAPFSLPQGIIGSIFLVYLVGTVSASTAGRLVGRLGRRGALYLAGGTTAAGLLVSLADSLPLVLLGLVLITAGFFAGHAVASSAVSKTATTGRAQASALYQSAYYIGSSTGSTVGAMAFHAGGWAGTVGVGSAGGARGRDDHCARVAGGQERSGLVAVRPVRRLRAPFTYGCRSGAR
jgi:YNFM family putative membrane transporter